jgi:hypothetical protein
MPVCYKIDKDRRLVITTGYGVVTRQDIEEHQRSLWMDPDFSCTFSQLADFSRMARMELNAVDMHSFSKRNIFAPDARRAVIVPNDVAFGLARLFEILRGSKGENGIRVFRTVEEGFVWILSGSAVKSPFTEIKKRAANVARI